MSLNFSSKCKLVCLCFFSLVYLNKVYTQGIGVNATGNKADLSAMLDVSASNKGILIPRVFLKLPKDGKTIQEPSHSLLIFNTNNNLLEMPQGEGYYYNTGTSADPYWSKLTTNTDGWLITGNAGTNSTLHFMGTSDNQDVVFKRNFIEALRITSGGALLAENKADVNIGFTPTSGPGIRLMWIPAKAAFRAGKIENTQWDDANIGTASFAAGMNTVAAGNYSTAFGYGALAAQDYSISIGRGSYANGQNAIAMGYGALSGKANAIAIGYQTIANASQAVSIGNATHADGINAVALGKSSTASGLTSTAFGNNTQAIGNYSTSMGNGSKALSDNSIAMGLLSTAGGDNSVAGGAQSIAEGNTAVSFGRENLSHGDYSFTTGYGSESNGNVGTAMGRISKANGDYSTAIGYLNIADGKYAVAIGREANATGVHSVGLGFRPKAVGDNSIAIGSEVEANGDHSSAFGYKTKANGAQSTALGVDNEANASFSTAMGSQTIASGQAATSMGYATRAKAYSSLVIGSFNDVIDFPIQALPNPGYRAFQIGNGTSENNRSNAFTVQYNGNTGINVVSPTTQLHINNYNNNQKSTGIRIQNSNYVNKAIDLNYDGAAFSVTIPTTDRFKIKRSDNTIIADFGNPNSFINNGLTVTNLLTAANDLTVLGDITYWGALNKGSDRRLKENITPLQNVLDRVKQIQPIYYNYKKEFVKNSHKEIGFVAQEVKKQFPELTGTLKNGYLTVDYASMSAVLLQAIKEQQQTIDDQGSEMTDVKKMLQQVQSNLLEQKKINTQLADENSEIKKRLEEIEKRLND